MTGKPLRTLGDLQQRMATKTSTNMDCGPTCLAFLRYGGFFGAAVQTYGIESPLPAPKEGGQVLSLSDMYKLCDRMRQETGAGNQMTPLGFTALQAIADEFCRVWNNKQYDFQHHLQDVDDIASVVSLIPQWLKLGDGRGVVIREAQNRDNPRSIGHFVVVGGVGSQSGHQSIVTFDPAGELEGLPSAVGADDLEPWLTKYSMERSQKTISVGGVVVPAPAAFAMEVLFSQAADKNHYIVSGMHLGTVHLNYQLSGPTNVPLVVAGDASYFSAYTDADAKAWQWAQSQSTAVVECPAGTFAVMRIEDPGPEAQPGGTVSRYGGDTESIFGQDDYWRQTVSIKLCLRVRATGTPSVYVLTDRSDGSHRPAGGK